MNWLASIGMGLRALLGKSRVESELNEELEAYVEAEVAEMQRRGMSAEEAQNSALSEMGSRSVIKHRIWTSRWESSVEALLKDLHIGMRGLGRTPGFTIVALLSLALGIGANTAIFTLLNAVMLRPLPVPHPEQLLLFGRGRDVGSTGGMPTGTTELFSDPFFREFASRASSFNGVAAQSSIQMGSHISIAGGSPEHVSIDLVSGNYFGVLALKPAMGRLLGDSDDQAAGASPVAVASFGWFERHFQGDPASVGRSVHIEGHDYIIVGVAQPGFTGIAPARPTDLWIPLSMEKEISPGWNGLMDHDFQSLYLFGRSKPGVTAKQADLAANLLFRQIIRDQYLGGNASARELGLLQKARVDLTSASGGLPGLKLRYSAPLEILMLTVGLVLLIACANVANMLFARGVARGRELAVRQALGATRRRIVVQLLAESSLLSAAGAGLGSLLAWRGVHLLLSLASPGAETMPLDLSPDYRVLGFTLLITGLTPLLFGIAPALRSARLELAPALCDGRGVSSASSRGVLSRSLIVCQLVLSILLLALAGLFLRSLRNLSRVDVGFDPRNVTVFSLDEYTANLPLDERLVQLQGEIEQEVQALPGVESASFSMFTFNQGMWSDGVTMQGVARNPANSEDVLYNVVGTQFLKTLSIPLVAGRNFNAQDNATSPHVAIVNETLARTFFPHQSPLGHRFCICDQNMGHGQKLDFDVEIVGVVRDAKYVEMGEQQHMAAYFPYAQRIQYFGNFSVKSTVAMTSLTPMVQHAIRHTNPEIVIAQAEPLAAEIQGSIATQRLIGLLSALFAGLAVFLVSIGIYGLMAYSVARRTKEIGIRVALGAQMSKLIWMVLDESLVLLGAGLLIGVPVALGATHGIRNLLEAQLFEVTPADPAAFLAAVFLISTITLMAAWIPARRAAKIDPLTALRCE